VLFFPIFVYNLKIGRGIRQSLAVSLPKFLGYNIWKRLGEKNEK